MGNTGRGLDLIFGCFVDRLLPTLFYADSKLYNNQHHTFRFLNFSI